MTKISMDDANKKWGFVDKLEYLIGIQYNKKDHGLYVPNSIDTIPAGLKGVDVVYVHCYHFPEFIAPDFRGKIKYNTGSIEMPQEWIENAKKNYQENEEIVRLPRYDRFMDSWSVLPDNMRFFEDDSGQICLDLTRTHIRKVGDIYLQGVDKIIMPPVQMELSLSFPKKMVRHKGRQMVHSKPRIVE